MEKQQLASCHLMILSGFFLSFFLGNTLSEEYKKKTHFLWIPADMYTYNNYFILVKYRTEKTLENPWVQNR